MSGLLELVYFFYPHKRGFKKTKQITVFMNLHFAKK